VPARQGKGTRDNPPLGDLTYKKDSGARSGRGHSGLRIQGLGLWPQPWLYSDGPLGRFWCALDCIIRFSYGVTIR
jgi:hypothetical protein